LDRSSSRHISEDGWKYLPKLIYNIDTTTTSKNINQAIDL
jgi:hypothetical protein